MIISDLFFLFFLQKSDNFRTVGRYFWPQKTRETPIFRGFRDGNQIASSRLRGFSNRCKLLILSIITRLPYKSTSGRSDSFRTVSDYLIFRKMFNLARFKIKK